LAVDPPDSTITTSHIKAAEARSIKHATLRTTHSISCVGRPLTCQIERATAPAALRLFTSEKEYTVPNWCENAVDLVAPTIDAACDIERELKAGNLFNFYLPVQDTDQIAGPGLPNWYVERLTRWGVKWDVNPEQAVCLRNGCNLQLHMATAWDAPIPFYEHLLGSGFQVKATYFEPNMLIGGQLTSAGHETWTHSGGILTRDDIPNYLYRAFGGGSFDHIFDDNEGDTWL
jgi:hypothetical protein